MKTSPDALGTIENESGNANMETGPSALGNSQKQSGSAKHVYETRRPRYRPKCVRESKT
jgi:hypothetical protein